MVVTGNLPTVTGQPLYCQIKLHILCNASSNSTSFSSPPFIFLNSDHSYPTLQSARGGGTIFFRL